MFEVIEMYGDYEPWWFFTGWEKDIQEKKQFSTLETAQNYFSTREKILAEKYSKERAKDQFLTTFWNEGELRFCQECDDDLQQYKGLLLLKDGHKIENETPIEHHGRVCPLSQQV